MGIRANEKNDAYIAIRGSNNVFENSDVPSEDIKGNENIEAGFGLEQR